MEEHRLKNTVNKLNRLNVSYELQKNSFILRGTSLSKGKLVLTILLPILFFVLTLTILVILILSPEIDRIVFPRIILIFPLLLLYYGVKNLIKLKKSKKNQIDIMSGKIVFKNRNNNKIVVLTENITEMLINIEENSSNAIGEIYVSTDEYQPLLLLSIIDNNVKYLKDDLDYIKNTFLMILNLK
jgi:hypothetical protein